MNGLAALFDGPGDAVVARGRAGARTRAELWAAADCLAAVLPEPTEGSLVVLAFGDDRFGLLASLCAVWRRGHGAAVTADATRARIQPLLQHPRQVALLHDTRSGRAHRVGRLLPATRGDRARSPAADAPTPALVFAVEDPATDSGVRLVELSAEQVLEELAALGARLPLGTEQRVVHACAPGFPPALWLGTLLPLSRGAAIDLDAPAGAASLAARAREPGVRAVLATGAALADLAALPPPTECAVFAPEASPRTAARVPFPVHVAPTGTGAPAPIDHLPALDALRDLDGVDDLAALPTPEGDVVLLAIAGNGAKAAAEAAPRALPDGRNMAVRAFERLPRDANGALRRAELCLAFGRGRRGQRVSTALDWTVVACDGDAATLRAPVPADHRSFEGHFTGYPVLAGAVQLHEFVLPCLRRVAGEVPSLTGLDGLKFLSRIAPGDTVDVVLTRTDGGRRVTFELRRGAVRCTSGRGTFAADVPAFTAT